MTQDPAELTDTERGLAFRPQEGSASTPDVPPSPDEDDAEDDDEGEDEDDEEEEDPTEGFQEDVNEPASEE